MGLGLKGSGGGGAVRTERLRRGRRRREGGDSRRRQTRHRYSGRRRRWGGDGLVVAGRAVRRLRVAVRRVLEYGILHTGTAASMMKMGGLGLMALSGLRQLQGAQRSGHVGGLAQLHVPW